VFRAGPRVALIATVVVWNIAFLFVGHLGIWLSVGAAAAVLMAAALAGSSAKWSDLLRPSAPRLAIGFGAAAALVVLSEVLYLPLTRAWPALAAESHRLFALFGAPTPLQAWVVLPAIAAAEEVIFRGALLDVLEARWPRSQAALVATAAYGLAHAASGRWALVGLAVVCGGLWTFLRSATRSLWPSLVCHVGWDLAILVIWPLIDR
jgi:membrane protease YdiL (CAAX protease family)